MDTRSGYGKYKDALFLRRLFRNSIACATVYWYLNHRRYSIDDSNWDRANKLVGSLFDRLNDVRHAAARTLQNFEFRACVRERSLKPLSALNRRCADPLIPKPWSLVKMRDLPLLADLKDLRTPRNIKTIILDLDVVFRSIDYNQGWRLVERKQAASLARYLGRHFELIFWTNEKYPVGQAIIGKWGIPSMGILHLDDASMTGRVAQRDLSRLGRDLNRVVRVCTDPATIYPDQEDNTIVIDPHDPDALQGLFSYFRKLTLHSGDVRSKLRELGTDQQSIHNESKSIINRLTNFLFTRHF